jgi:hypothetical protein
MLGSPLPSTEEKLMEMTEQHPRAHLPTPVLTNRWAWWGIGAGVLGIVANLVTDPITSLTTAQKQQGPAVLGLINRADLQIGNANTYPRSGLYSILMLNDSAPYFAWWGVVVAAAGVAWLAFRERLVVRWVGVVSVLAVLAAFAWLALTGLTDFGGIARSGWPCRRDARLSSCNAMPASSGPSPSCRSRRIRRRSSSRATTMRSRLT